MSIINTTASRKIFHTVKKTKLLLKKFFVITLTISPVPLFADSIEKIGSTFLIALPVATAGISFGKHDTQGFKQYLLDLGVSTGTTLGLKYIVTEKRPNGGSRSFPSEHAAIAFSSAGYVWRRYGYQYGIPATLCAGFVGYSRVEANKHYWHDVVGGAAIGLLSSYLFVKPLQISYSTHSIEINYEHKLTD